jgi:hypothetical protein
MTGNLFDQGLGGAKNNSSRRSERADSGLLHRERVTMAKNRQWFMKTSFVAVILAWSSKATIVFFAVTVASNAFCSDDSIAFHNTVTAGVTANEVISESGQQLSFSLGFDYLYRFHPKWEVDVQLDLNYDRSFEHHESDALVPIVAYSVTERLPVFLGVGIERERDTGHTEWLARLGFEYTFFLDRNERVMLLPGGFLDYLDGDVLLSAVLAVGFMF